MTKNERTLIGSEIKSIIKEYKTEWQELKEQVYSQGYQPIYFAEDDFKFPIKKLINNLSNDTKQSLINEWKSRKERMQFQNDAQYLQQYELYILEEIVMRASKATYWM